MFEELRIEVNDACNFSCVHCYTDKHGPKGLPADVFLGVIKEAALRGATDLSLTGGEPLLAKLRTLQMIRAGADAGLRVRLNTNGFLLDEELALALKDAGLTEIQISLSSADEADFDAFARRPGAFKGVHRAIAASVQAGLFVSVRYTLMIINCHQLRPTFQMVESWGVRKFKVRGLVQVGGIKEEAWLLERGRLLEALEELVSAASVSSVEVSIADNGLGVPLPHADGNCKRNHCKCGSKAVFVAADGQISPCPFLREESAFVLGNLAEDDLFDIYANSAKLRAFIGDRGAPVGGNDCTESCKAAVLALDSPGCGTAVGANGCVPQWQDQLAFIKPTYEV